MAYDKIQRRGRKRGKDEVIFTFDFDVETTAGTFWPEPLADQTQQPEVFLGAGAFTAGEITRFQAGELVQVTTSGASNGRTPAQIKAELIVQHDKERTNANDKNKRIRLFRYLQDDTWEVTG